MRTCITSPPYWGLRAYNTQAQIWQNGHELCDKHAWEKHTCARCGAWRGELGLEPNPELYVAHLVQVFRAVRDVLADDGTLWVNLGDSFAGSNGGKGDYRSDKKLQRDIYDFEKPQTKIIGLKPKDRVGIPHMVAFALRADGWYWRDEIVWHKPNPMPESVKDRTTKAHEFIFLFSKSPKYFYDYEAILEPAKYDGRKDTLMKGSKKYANGHAPSDPNSLHLKGHERWSRKLSGTEYAGDGAGLKTHSGSYDAETGEYLGHLRDGIPARNKRSVWSVPTRPYKGAHFATFPPNLIEPCVLAGSARGDIVLDPFGGSGTVAEVALRHGRGTILIELNAEYVALQRQRLDKVQMTLERVGE